MKSPFLETNTKSIPSVKKMVGKPFAEVASNHPLRICLPDISLEVRQAIRDTECKCISECSDSLNKSTLCCILHRYQFE